MFSTRLIFDRPHFLFLSFIFCALSFYIWWTMLFRFQQSANSLDVQVAKIDKKRRERKEKNDKNRE